MSPSLQSRNTHFTLLGGSCGAWHLLLLTSSFIGSCFVCMTGLALASLLLLLRAAQSGLGCCWLLCSFPRALPSFFLGLWRLWSTIRSWQGLLRGSFCILA